MALTPLPTLSKGKKKKKGLKSSIQPLGLRSFFSEGAHKFLLEALKEEGPRALSKIGKATVETGQLSLQGGAAIAGAIPGVPRLTPTGRFQQDLFGTDKEISFGSTGTAARGGTKRIAVLDPLLGAMVGLADVTPFGKPARAGLQLTPKLIKLAKAAKVGDLVTSGVAAKYGVPLAESIFEVGGRALAEKSLVMGGEEAVRGALGIKPVEGVVKTLVKAINEAKPVGKEARALAAVERGKRATAFERTLQSGTGEGGFSRAMSRLRDELPRPRFGGIRSKLVQGDVDSLFNHIRTAPNLNEYDKVSVGKSLWKVLGSDGGKVPTALELEKLKRVFGNDLVQALLKKRRFGQKLFQTALEAFNIPRALMASSDMSATLRQGAFLVVHKPKIATRAFVSQLGFLFRPKYFEAAMQEIAARPTFGLMKKAGLDLTEVSGEAITLGAKEEEFMTNLLSKLPELALRGGAKIPGLGGFADKVAKVEKIANPIRASERAYVGFLNKLRADVFDDITRQMLRAGETFESQPKAFEDFAKFINTATGRGALELDIPARIVGQSSVKVPLQAAPALNTVFFSPRLLTSRLQMINPFFYSHLHPAARKEAMKSLAKFVGTGLTILTLAELSGADVEKNPLSSDFGKMKIGNVRYDIWGGFQPIFRYGAQIMLGKRKTLSKGEILDLRDDFPFDGRGGQIARFARSKLSPGASFFADWLIYEEDFLGRDFEMKKALLDRAYPLWIQDYTDALRAESGRAATPAGLAAFLGVGITAFKPGSATKKKEEGKRPLPSLRR